LPVGPLFHWTRQHSRVTAFFGTSENAAKPQIWISVSVYVLVGIVKTTRFILSRSIYEIPQILSLNLIEKTPLDTTPPIAVSPAGAQMAQRITLGMGWAILRTP